MRQIVRTTGFLLAAMAAGYIGSLMGQAERPVAAQGHAPAVQDVVTAKRFELVDANGKERGSFFLRDDGSPFLVLKDTEGKKRGSFSLVNGQPSLSLSDADGKHRGLLSLGKDGSPHLSLTDADGNALAALPK